MTSDQYVVGTRRAQYDGLAFIRDTEDYFLLYCENELKYPKVSFSIWLSPFDLLTWMLSLIAVTASAGVIGNKIKGN